MIRQVGGGVAILTLERTFICYIVDQKDTHGASVVRCRDSAEAFLAGCVPNLQLHPLSVQLDRSDLEINADSSDEGRSEGVFTEAQ